MSTPILDQAMATVGAAITECGHARAAFSRPPLLNGDGIIPSPDPVLLRAIAKAEERAEEAQLWLLKAKEIARRKGMIG